MAVAEAGFLNQHHEFSFSLPASEISTFLTTWKTGQPTLFCYQLRAGLESRVQKLESLGFHLPFECVAAITFFNPLLFFGRGILPLIDLIPVYSTAIKKSSENCQRTLLLCS